MFAGGNPADLSALISTRHVGSVVLIGNWNNGTAAAKTAADALQSYAPSGNQLIVSTDQEGGQVQHLKGSGFDTMPSAVAQGQMSADTLRSSAKTWGASSSKPASTSTWPRYWGRCRSSVPRTLRLAR